MRARREGRRSGRARVGRRRVRRGRTGVLLSLLGIAGGITLLAAGAAFAYFQTTDASHPAAALAGTLLAPTGGTQNGTATPSSIPIKWTAPSGYTPSGYIVLRCTGTCTPSSPPANGGCSGTVSLTSCTDTDTSLAANTTYTYAVEATFHSWTSPLSSTFQVTTTSITKLTFTVQPSVNQNIQATGTGTFSASVAIVDGNGSTDVNDNTDTVTLAIGTNPSSGVLTCANTGGLTVTVSSGVANFTGCAITKAGTGYKLTASSGSAPSLAAPTNANAFNIIAGTAAKLVLTTQPTVNQNIQAAGTGSFPAAVSVEDANGNVETSDSGTSVTLAIGTNPSGGVLTCTNTGGLTVNDVAGVASYTGCAITKAGTGYTLTASSTPSLTAPANANAFNIIAGTATKLVLTTQPTVNQNIQATGTGSFPAAVSVEDANGNVETGDSGTSVTLAIGTNPSGGVLTCTNTGGLTVNDVAGVASYTGCAITKAGTGYTLTASSSPSLTAPANANAFNITAGNAAGLSFANVTTALGATGITCTGAVGTSSYNCTINAPLLSVVFYSANVTLIDQNQNLVTNAGPSLTVSLSTTAGVLSPSTVTIPNNSSTSSSTFSVILSLGTTTASATVNSSTVFAKLTP